jgi:hypothetical protein
MANSYTKTYSMVQDWQKPFQRQKPYPLDSTSIFSSYEDAVKYAKGDGSDSGKLGGAAYVGQIISVYENGSVSVYKIEEDRTLAAVGGTNTLEVTYYEDLNEIAKIKLGQLVKVKDVKEGDSHLAGFYIYNGTSFDHLSVSTGATDEVAALKSKVEIVEGKISGLEGEIYALVDGEKSYVFYTKDEVTEILSSYVTSTKFNEELAKYAKTDDVNNSLSNKLDKGTFETYQSTVSTTYATKDELSTGLSGKADSGHNHDTEYADLQAFNSLKEAFESSPSKYFIKSLGGDDTYSASYQLWQKVGETESAVEGAATINIPKDMVVSGGEVVTNPEGQEEGTYIKLTLANATNDVLYIPASKLVDTYKGDSYINVNGYTLSLNVSTLASALATDNAFTSKYVSTQAFNSYKEANETAYKTYADDKANTAESNAKTYVNSQLELYTKTSDLSANYVDKEAYDSKVSELSGKIQSNSGSIETINNVITSAEHGNTILLGKINATNSALETTNGNVSKNAQDIISINSNLETLGSSVVKTISLGGTDYTPSNGKVTITLADEISSENLTAIPSVKAVNDAITLINTNISNRTTISLVPELPAEGNENVIYIVTNGSKKTEHIFIGDGYYQLGSDTYATKALATANIYAEDGSTVISSGTNGLMSADDKTKLDNIQAITNSELLSILEVK